MRFKPDYSLIRQWDKTTLPLAAPYVSHFNKASKQLRYIAARHEGGTASPTLRTVKQEFDAFKPDVVIVEGVPNTGEISPAWYLAHCREQAKTDFKAGGEGSYATVLAGERGIDFVPGEPSAKALYEGLLAQGFTQEDAAGFDLTVILRHLHGAGIINDGDAEDLVEERAKGYFAELGLDNVKYDYRDFTDWYKERMGERFSLANLAARDASPSTAANANFLQKLMAAGDNVREPHIVKIIAEQLEKHDRVLVVYGSAHSGKHEPALAKMLGAPQHLKNF
jgi:hypothetical protein